MGYSFMKAKKVHLRDLEERENTEAIKVVNKGIGVTIFGLVIAFVLTIVNFFLTMCSTKVLLICVLLEVIFVGIGYFWYEVKKN